MFSLDDFNFKEDPIGALKQMIGESPTRKEQQEANLLNYKKGEISFYAFVHDYDEVASLYNMIYDTIQNKLYEELLVPDAMKEEASEISLPKSLLFDP